MAVGECAKAFLPGESARHPPVSIDEVGRSVLDVSYHIRQRNGWLEADEDMGVVRHAMHSQKFLPALRDDSGDVLMKFLLVSLVNQILPSFDRENNLEIDL